MDKDDLRDGVFRYVKEKYKSDIEYLWPKYPGYAVFRHKDNKKWYGLIMNIPGSKLGLNNTDTVDILNVKPGDPLMLDMMIRQKGFFSGYHMNKGNWMSVLLDGTVPFDEICRWIDISFSATASRETKNRIRPPKEWIIPANPRYYDIENAFESSDTIVWKQGKGIRNGDTVFIYAAAPISAVIFRCAVLKTDIPYDSRNDELNIKALMEIKLSKRYDTDVFTFQILRERYGVAAIRGPRGIPDKLSEDLDNTV